VFSRSMERRVATNLNIPQQVTAWLRATFVEDVHGALKKAEMYGEYERFCKECRMKPKDPNTFGKYVLRVFPTAYPSRLGSILDGSQAHCYSGISRMQQCPPPPANVPLRETSAEPCSPSTAGVFIKREEADVSPMVDAELEAMVEAMLAEAETDDTSCYLQQPSPPTFSPYQSFVWWKTEQPDIAMGCESPEEAPMMTECSSECSSYPYFRFPTSSPPSSTMYSEVPLITNGYDDFANYDFNNFMGNCSC